MSISTGSFEGFNFEIDDFGISAHGPHYTARLTAHNPGVKKAFFVTARLAKIEALNRSMNESDRYTKLRETLETKAIDMIKSGVDEIQHGEHKEVWVWQ